MLDNISTVMAIHVLFLSLSLVTTFSVITAQCSSGKEKCDWLDWNEWDSCSRTCGGGSQIRHRKGMCCQSDWTYDECLDNCGKDRSESFQRRNCNEVCENGAYCNSVCNCPEYLYDNCCGSGNFTNYSQRYRSWQLKMTEARIKIVVSYLSRDF